MNILKIGAGLIALTLTSQCLAAKIVYDPWNMAKNAVTAAQQASATAANLKQLAVQQQDFILQVRNITAVKPDIVKAAIERGMLPAGAIDAATGVQVAREAAGVYAILKSGQDEMTKLYQVLGRVGQVGQILNSQAAAGNSDPGEMLQYQGQQALAGRENAAREYLQLRDGLSELEYHKARTDTIMKQLPEASGALEAIQEVGMQTGVLSDQLSQMITIQTKQAVTQQKRELVQDDDRYRDWLVGMEAEARNCKMYGMTYSKRCPEYMKYYKK